MEHETTPSFGETDPVSRRDALKKGALIAGAVFAVPVIETISLSPAAAQTPSSGYWGTGTGGQGQNQNGQGQNHNGQGQSGG